MKEANHTPAWIPILFGLVTCAMGVLILGAALGLVPADPQGFFAPRWIVAAIGAGCLLAALLFWIPAAASARLKAALAAAFFLLVALVCNWTAFAPGDGRFSSSTSLGPFQVSGAHAPGGRLVFGLLALALDVLLVWGLVARLRPGAPDQATQPPLELCSERLRLMALTSQQLELYLAAPGKLEQELGLPLSRAILTPIVHQAIQTKLFRMARVERSRHPWHTYWLVAVADPPYGAGLAGFKGYPDPQGQVEIGYGLDPAFQNQGYTTEAVRALIAWAFESPACRSVLADARKDNLPSRRVLEKAGFRLYDENEDTQFWRIDKD